MNHKKQLDRFKGLSYEQTIRTKAFPLDEGTLRTEAVLDDTDHHIEIFLVVTIKDKTIVDAGARMLKQPYPNCHLGMERVSKIIGLRIEKGLTQRMSQRVGGRRGCVHLLELLMSAARLSANAILGLTVGEKKWETITDRDEDFHARLMTKLEGMCVGFDKDLMEGGE